MGNVECKFCPDIILNIKLDDIVGICCSGGKIESLKSRMRDLKALKIDVGNKIEDNRSTQVEVSNEVKAWVEEVDRLEEEVSAMGNVSTSCCFICSNIRNYPDILSKTSRVEDLIGQQSRWTEDSMFTPIQRTAILGCLPRNVVGMENVLLQALEFLKDEKVGVVGIHGMGGAGKTTLAKLIIKSLNSSSSAAASTSAPKFEKIIWATVSQNQDTLKLQEDIAVELGLNENGGFKDKDASERARFLHSYLSVRRFLLVLDDVWEEIDLSSIGIPDLVEGKKLLLTTREEKVCTVMQARKSTVKVGCLGEQHSWELFRKTMQWDDDELPLVLITIARTMASKTFKHLWEHVEKEMKKSLHIESEMEERVYKLLEISFNNLKSEECKDCLLYSALFPEDEEIRIDTIVDYCIGGGSVSNASSSSSNVSDDLVKLRGDGKLIISELMEAPR